ncbi:hypothetical protein ATANTOWER_026292 [Ataeniobius toweri]|uniref:Uncharacterized protein n=1 Tax=Ataeniobius toweri TaxID=208326 RepID=A0ABU7BMD7_9TELE|nr:hypothetical protein [Ataeniobius toweri]
MPIIQTDLATFSHQEQQILCTICASDLNEDQQKYYLRLLLVVQGPKHCWAWKRGATGATDLGPVLVEEFSARGASEQYFVSVYTTVKIGRDLRAGLIKCPISLENKIFTVIQKKTE